MATVLLLKFFDAIGARVFAPYGGKVRAQSVVRLSSYLSVNDRRLQFRPRPRLPQPQSRFTGPEGYHNVTEINWSRSAIDSRCRLVATIVDEGWTCFVPSRMSR